MLSVKSVEQMNFIYVLAKDQNHTGVWLSASRVEAEDSKFVWNDGSELEYSNWGSIWPSNDTERKCVVFSRLHGKWNDAKCTESYEFN
ncbi:macrophage mannose receptor 1-like protein [Leptotrombidium deliense]|uniref:Macrophage mannose receptor 1-like protein n=1 Tax=Leptotrombidium deliense TaxID=299467 RepID=A0A443RV48_9ACAR|nr:macrophage mannose receptor 1-like protein [Leptotrombidium deliense]